LQHIVAATANQYAFSVWLKGTVGGEQLYLSTSPDGSTYYRQPVTLTTVWQRFTLVTPALTATTWYFFVGVDTRDASQSIKPAQTIFVWGAQTEVGAFPTSYTPTTAAAVTRAADSCVMLPASITSWFASPGGSWSAEFINFDATMTGRNARIVGQAAAGGVAQLYEPASLNVAQYDGAGPASPNLVTANAVTRAASTWAPGNGKICLNGGSVAQAVMSTGYAICTTSGIAFLASGAGVVSESMTGYIRRVRYWPRVLSDAELQSVTT
jgi:hypothetical protein